MPVLHLSTEDGSGKGEGKNRGGRGWSDEKKKKAGGEMLRCLALLALHQHIVQSLGAEINYIFRVFFC